MPAPRLPKSTPQNVCSPREYSRIEISNPDPFEVCSLLRKFENWPFLQCLCVDFIEANVLASLKPTSLLAKVVFGSGSSLLTACLSESPFDLAKAKKLKELGANPNMTLPGGRAPLCFCATEAAVKFLIEELHVDLTAPIDGVSSAVAAIMTITGAALEYFLSGPHVKQMESARGAPFWEPSVVARDFEIWVYTHTLFSPFRDFLDANMPTLLRLTAVGEGKPPSISTVVSNRGDTLLHLCSKFGVVSATKALLESGASANVTNDRGQLPLHLFLIRSDKGVWPLLFKATTVPFDFSVRVPVVASPYLPVRRDIAVLHAALHLEREPLLRLAVETCPPETLRALLSEKFRRGESRPIPFMFVLVYKSCGLKVLLEFMQKSEFDFAPFPDVASEFLWPLARKSSYAAIELAMKRGLEVNIYTLLLLPHDAKAHSEPCPTTEIVQLLPLARIPSTRFLWDETRDKIIALFHPQPHLEIAAATIRVLASAVVQNRQLVGDMLHLLRGERFMGSMLRTLFFTREMPFAIAGFEDCATAIIDATNEVNPEFPWDEASKSLRATGKKFHPVAESLLAKISEIDSTAPAGVPTVRLASSSESSNTTKAHQLPCLY